MAFWPVGSADADLPGDSRYDRGHRAPGRVDPAATCFSPERPFVMSDSRVLSIAGRRVGKAVGELDGVRVYVQDGHVILTKRDLYP